MIEDKSRKVGINVSVPFSEIVKIDNRARKLGYNKRSNYIWSLIFRDLNLDERE